MKKIYILLSFGVVLFLGCSPTGGNPDAKPSFNLREIFSKNDRVFINCSSVEYEVVNNATLKKVPLDENEELRTTLRDESSARIALKRQIYNAYTLYNSKGELVTNYFARDVYPFIGAFDESGKLQHDDLIDKVSFDGDMDIKLLETCYSLGRWITIDNKGYPVYAKARLMGCENLSKHYVAWWDEKLEKMAITELNDFFKDYTDKDMYQYLPVPKTEKEINVFTRLMVNSKGIYKVDWESGDSRLNYTYIPSDNSKKSVHFSKIIDKNNP